MPELVINGQAESFSQAAFPVTVMTLINAKGLNAKAVVAEVDGEIVPREAFFTHALKPGSRVELVQFVGGG